MSFSEIKDFSITINADTKLLDIEVVKNHLSKKFKNSSSLYHITRLRRLKNNEIYLISRAFIPTDLVGKNLNKSIFRDKNLVAVLINNFNIKIIKSEQEIAAVKLNTNDANLFKITQDYPAISNTWYMYDRSKRLVLMDQELTIRPLKVENYYQ